MSQIRVLIVDDSPMCREGLRLILEQQPGIAVVGEASDGASGVDRATDLQPDVVLIDVQMPGMDGIEATRRIKQTAPRSEVICLGCYPDFLDDALVAGAARYILKDTLPRELVSAVLQVAQLPA